MNHPITYADAIEWIVNGAVNVLITTLVIIALRELLFPPRDPD